MERGRTDTGSAPRYDGSSHEIYDPLIREHYIDPLASPQCQCQDDDQQAANECEIEVEIARLQCAQPAGDPPDRSPDRHEDRRTKDIGNVMLESDLVNEVCHRAMLTRRIERRSIDKAV